MYLHMTLFKTILAYSIALAVFTCYSHSLNEVLFFAIVPTLTFLFALFASCLTLKWKNITSILITVTLFSLLNKLFYTKILHAYSNGFQLFEFFILIKNLIFSFVLYLYLEKSYSMDMSLNVSVQKKKPYLLSALTTAIYIFIILSTRKSTPVLNLTLIYEAIYHFLYRLTSNSFLEEILFRVCLFSIVKQVLDKKQSEHAYFLSMMIVFVVWAIGHNGGQVPLLWYLFAFPLHAAFTYNYYVNKNYIFNTFLHALINTFYYLFYTL